ncbi:MAG: HNH endonuclease [Alicyclobacillus sp.]|nr:HNH endonuclease [Alicyclobacillus sp.]
MKIYIGVTDHNWYRLLADERPEEVNFWQPGGRQPFKVLQPNELFLFKLHSPYDYVVGGGFFVRHSFLPMSLAWKAFGRNNGTADYHALQSKIYQYRRTSPRTEPDPVIGCIVLASPFFFSREQWIPVPDDWKSNIVQGKSYDTNHPIGKQLLLEVRKRLQDTYHTKTGMGDVVREISFEQRYGIEQVFRPRLGQGAFRVMVTEAYHRRCAITGEKTLPVLDAAHIKPYSLNGPHAVTNGLLLRQDFHTLFDRGYITVNPDFRVEVSRRIKDDYGNGREYYALHGRRLVVLPEAETDRPSQEYLRWHNENVFLA